MESRYFELEDIIKGEASFIGEGFYARTRELLHTYFPLFYIKNQEDFNRFFELTPVLFKEDSLYKTGNVKVCMIRNVIEDRIFLDLGKSSTNSTIVVDHKEFSNKVSTIFSRGVTRIHSPYRESLMNTKSVKEVPPKEDFLKEKLYFNLFTEESDAVIL